MDKQHKLIHETSHSWKKKFLKLGEVDKDFAFSETHDLGSLNTSGRIEEVERENDVFLSQTFKNTDFPDPI